MGVRARARAESGFGYDRMIDETVSLYRSLLAARAWTAPIGSLSTGQRRNRSSTWCAASLTGARWGGNRLRPPRSSAGMVLAKAQGFV